ncbi:winged helix-turn-helix transcriptional regulator [Xinfangfangia sp. D13-10-4-6]|uniref:MarR family winged helix-turn-helix transcriptional regulator n=1 Tax=Pseudogemmobacter hezensis TaxID=2737662 RepID=UPI00155506C5|nr:MarR family winged helix-turn-helix transcriptional regulator [Pseudogemmobacter hezensis]NPD14842.1 winged helix-turn-helix transcriptional regulator [Pseudogemmobacter hezensis]
MSSETPSPAQRLGQIGLSAFPPYLMNRLMSQYNGILRGEMADMGLTTAKMRALGVLSVMDGPLIRELAELAVTEQSTLSRALDQLQAEGLVRRETDANDSRATRVFSTDQGRAAFERIWPHMALATERMFRGISDEERHAFVGTLQKMLANICKQEV